MRRAWNRLFAFAVDWLCILGWAAVIAAAVGLLRLAGIAWDLDSIGGNVVSALALVLPVTVVFAALENGRRQATLGKRLRGLRVVDARSGARVPLRRTLLRNLLKIAVPWLIGHAAVYELVASGPSGDVPSATVVVTVAAYVLPILYVVGLFVGHGRTLYDEAAGTAVVRAAG
jgi:uncharacterized RDD family membrane protein YckC